MVVGLLDEVAEEAQPPHSSNGITSTNGDDLMASGGTMDDAASHESLNGAAAHLVFHSDGTGEPQGRADSSFPCYFYFSSPFYFYFCFFALHFLPHTIT